MDTTWQETCRQQGGAVTVFPRGYEHEGQSACRFKDANGKLVYKPVMSTFAYAADKLKTEGGYLIDQAEGKAAGVAEDALKATRGAVPNAISWLTGLPTWLIWLGVGYVGYRYLDSQLPAHKR